MNLRHVLSSFLCECLGAIIGTKQSLYVPVERMRWCVDTAAVWR